MTDAVRLADDVFAAILDADPGSASLLGVQGRDHLLADLAETPSSLCGPGSPAWRRAVTR